jgi:hypothetical protein
MFLQGSIKAKQPLDDRNEISEDELGHGTLVYSLVGHSRQRLS